MSSGVYFADAKSGIDKDFVLLVEGQDDAHFVDALLEDLGADPHRTGVLYIKGKDKLSENLKNLKKSRPFLLGKIRRVAIIRDADTSGAEALQSIQNALRDFDLAMPNHADFAQAPDSPDIGIFILPSDQTDGDLERVCLTTLGSDERLAYVRDFLRRVQERFGALDRMHKREAMAYFSAVPVETRGVGWAFRKTDLFDRAHSSLDPLKDFLRRFIS